MNEQEFIHTIQNNHGDDSYRLIYADWLEEHGDPRAEFLRVQLAVVYLSIDHPVRQHIDEQFTVFNASMDPDWLRNVDHPQAKTGKGSCQCYGKSWGLQDQQITLHNEVQDTLCDPWTKLIGMIDDAASLGAEHFSPFIDMPMDQRQQIITLPTSISELSMVEELNLYGSQLRYLPAEIGRMKNLKRFTPYTSYALHWFPYELTRCSEMADSTISTRALFGNFKSRSAFPQLKPWHQNTRVSDAFRALYEQHWSQWATRPCSVCDRDFKDNQEFRYWISLRVGTDVVPLLVNACSQSCIDSLPKGAKGHVQEPHKGGPDIIQPDRGWPE